MECNRFRMLNDFTQQRIRRIAVDYEDGRMGKQSEREGERAAGWIGWWADVRLVVGQWVAGGRWQAAGAVCRQQASRRQRMCGKRAAGGR